MTFTGSKMLMLCKQAAKTVHLNVLSANSVMKLNPSALPGHSFQPWNYPASFTFTKKRFHTKIQVSQHTKGEKGRGYFGPLASSITAVTMLSSDYTTDDTLKTGPHVNLRWSISPSEHKKMWIPFYMHSVSSNGGWLVSTSSMHFWAMAGSNSWLSGQTKNISLPSVMTWMTLNNFHFNQPLEVIGLLHLNKFALIKLQISGCT